MATKADETIAFEVYMTNLPSWWRKYLGGADKLANIARSEVLSGILAKMEEMEMIINNIKKGLDRISHLDIQRMKELRLNFSN